MVTIGDPFTLKSEGQNRAREKILKLYKKTPIPDEQILSNFGLYTPSIMIAKLLYLNELYQQILRIPGIVMEFGVWWGANLSLFNSLRSVHEPYNFTRKIVGFDTFKGHTSFSPEDGDSSYITELAKTDSDYAEVEEHEEHLRRVLQAQEEDNVVSHIKKYDIIKGNVVDTVSRYLEENRETIISLAYFDLGLYKPTKTCLEAIRPHLVRGSVLAMDELNSPYFPGETVALKEVLGLDRYKIVKSQYLHDRSYVIVE